MNAKIKILICISHDLAKLLDSVKKKRLFNLIKGAYVKARYNPKFIVPQEDVDALMPK